MKDDEKAIYTKWEFDMMVQMRQDATDNFYKIKEMSLWQRICFVFSPTLTVASLG